MPIRSASWAAVEEKLAMDFAIWKSRVAPRSRPQEQVELVEGAWMKMVDRGLATIKLGKLEWELAPPSGYTGYCEKQQEDWLLVSRSGFRVALRSPYGSGAVLQVCPCGGELAGLQSVVREGGVDISGLMTRFFTSPGVRQSTPPTHQRTMSLKKREETIDKKFGVPFLKCVSDVRNAVGVADVLDSILIFSAATVANQHILQPISEDSDSEDAYFYDIEGMEEAQCFNVERRNDSAWVRNQVRDAAMKCQVAAEAVSEAAKLGSRMLCNIQDPTSNEKEEKEEEEEEEESHGPMETDDFEFNTRSGFRMCSPPEACISTGPPSELKDGLSLTEEEMYSDMNESDLTGFSLDNALIEVDSWDGPTLSFGNEMVEMETSSATSWEFVRTNDGEEEDDVLGAGISDAESLSSMLRDRDPFGCDGCSHLVDEFLSLTLNSAQDQGKKVDGNEVRKTSVLKRLASWSSSNSSWSSATDRDSSSSGDCKASKKIQTLQLESLAEEPACDPYIASTCRSSVIRAAAVGDVLQWCSCKFNKSRSSIELRFQVGSFMEDDIATLSTGISRASPIRIEIFLDSTKMRQSLLEGRVRISTDQGGPKWPNVDSSPPVIGLSCYVPHLVRQYLQQSVREQANRGHDFPDGELVTGIMQHVVAKLVSQKYSCCVCNEPSLPDFITSMVPKPCNQNLCQALHNLWLVVAPRMELKCSTFEDWMRHCCFEKGNSSDEASMLQYMDSRWNRSNWMTRYDEKLENVMAWMKSSVLAESWLTLVDDDKPTMTDQEHQFRSNSAYFPRRRVDQGESFETFVNIWLGQFHVRPPSISLGSTWHGSGGKHLAWEWLSLNYGFSRRL